MLFKRTLNYQQQQVGLARDGGTQRAAELVLSEFVTDWPLWRFLHLYSFLSKAARARPAAARVGC